MALVQRRVHAGHHRLHILVVGVLVVQKARLEAVHRGAHSAAGTRLQHVQLRLHFLDTLALELLLPRLRGPVAQIFGIIGLEVHLQLVVPVGAPAGHRPEVVLLIQGRQDALGNLVGRGNGVVFARGPGVLESAGGHAQEAAEGLLADLERVHDHFVDRVLQVDPLRVQLEDPLVLLEDLVVEDEQVVDVPVHLGDREVLPEGVDGDLVLHVAAVFEDPRANQHFCFDRDRVALQVEEGEQVPVARFDYARRPADEDQEADKLFRPSARLRFSFQVVLMRCPFANSHL